MKPQIVWDDDVINDFIMIETGFIRMWLNYSSNFPHYCHHSNVEAIIMKDLKTYNILPPYFVDEKSANLLGSI